MPSTAPAGPCVACGEVAWRDTYQVPEIMHLAGEVFTLATCEACGSLGLADPPADLAPYYGEGYYSFAPFEERYRSAWQRWVKRRVVGAVAGPGDLLGGWLRQRSGYGLYRILEDLGPDLLGPGRAVLDVGCGGGELLRLLDEAGGRRLVGVDPFVEGERSFPGGARVLPVALEDLEEGDFDTIMFHHSLEHVPDPVATLAAARTRLAPGGTVVVRVPTCSSEAWERYREKWVQLDAPRHLWLPSREGLGRLAVRAGLTLAEVRDDSAGFQFWGSEQVGRGIPLAGPRSYAVDPAASPFSPEELAAWEQEAVALNAAGRGDQVIANLR
jgi:2-polyprenyl-3-methyl-5-hydroxy-6-metoxy-1,4-benzoquinol methylase